jgi:hypothetical protein
MAKETKVRYRKGRNLLSYHLNAGQILAEVESYRAERIRVADDTWTPRVVIERATGSLVLSFNQFMSTVDRATNGTHK